jgi:hypothetical protein
MSVKIPSNVSKWMDVAVSIAASAVIFGALQKILHTPIADLWLKIGLYTEALIFLLYGILYLIYPPVKEEFEANKEQLTGTLFATDQSPTYSKRVHWTNFLNQTTPVLLGAERFSREYDFPVIYGYIKKTRRGYYEMEVALLENDPVQTRDGEITEKHTRWLEKQINEAPQYWLWTHKRWKRKMKENDKLYQAL